MHWSKHVPPLCRASVVMANLHLLSDARARCAAGYCEYAFGRSGRLFPAEADHIIAQNMVVSTQTISRSLAWTIIVQAQICVADKISVELVPLIHLVCTVARAFWA